jgi:hypothetical protein
MSRQSDSGAGVFPATQWSLVDRAARSDAEVHRPALADIVARYLPALRAYLLASRRLPPDRADDLLQGFIADKLVEQRLLRQASRNRGRLRALLIVSLDRYVISQHRKDSAAARVPAEGLAGLPEEDVTVAASSAVDPGDSFNIEWARQLVAEAVARSQAECERSGRPDLWRILDARVLRPSLEGEEPLDYRQLVEELGLATPLQACALLTTAKRLFIRNLRAAAADYAAGDGGCADAVDAEINDLRQILSRRGAQSRTGLRT